MLWRWVRTQARRARIETWRTNRTQSDPPLLLGNPWLLPWFCSSECSLEKRKQAATKARTGSLQNAGVWCTFWIALSDCMWMRLSAMRWKLSRWRPFWMNWILTAYFSVPKNWRRWPSRWKEISRGSGWSSSSKMTR